MEPNAIDALTQLGIAGAIIGAVVYLQRAQAAQLERLVKLLRPEGAVSLAVEVKSLNAKVDSLIADVSWMRGHLGIDPDRPSAP